MDINGCSINLTYGSIDYNGTMKILCNGMIRSASTWLHNVTRYIIYEVENENDVLCGWCDDINISSNKKHIICKHHGINEELFKNFDIILYSYRDVRDVLSSAFRMWEETPSINAAQMIIYECNILKKRADYSMKYEDMLRDKEKIVTEISKTLGINNININNVIEKVEQIPKNNNSTERYDKESLYHKNHITDGREKAILKH